MKKQIAGALCRNLKLIGQLIVRKMDNIGITLLRPALLRIKSSALQEVLGLSTVL